MSGRPVVGLVALASLLTMLAASCLEGDDTGGEPTVARFSEINADIFEAKCTFACHSGGEFAAGGFDMQADPYGALVGAPATASECEDGAMMRIAPGEPDASLVYLKIVAKMNGTAAPCGEEMPPGDDQPGLTPDEAERLRSWIEAGAEND
jgi:hypothetical protein